MKEAIGGTVSLQIILIFLVFVNSFLAFSVSYTKAFRMKNKMINEIQNNEGYTEKTVSNIETYRKAIGYTGNVSASAKTYINANSNAICTQENGGYCVLKTKTNGGGMDGNYYTVITFIHTDFPIIGKILDQVPAFKITGQTSTIYNATNDKFGE